MMVVLATTLTVSFASAQKIKEAEVPKAVMESFNKNFKDVKPEKWEKEKNGDFEAEFDYNKIETSATFSPDGKLLETEQEIKIGELPKGVTDYVAKNYAGKKISEASKITTPDGKTMFEAEIDKKELLFDQQGNFIK